MSRTFKQGEVMSRYEDMYSYVKDPQRFAVCGEMASMIGNGESESKDKLAFESREMALKKSKETGVDKLQIPYLCQFCQYWHLGKNSRIGKDSRTFLLPYKKDYIIRDEVIPGRPLHEALLSLKIAQFVPEAIDELKMDKIINRNKLDPINIHRLGTFVAAPDYRAVVWALHLPQKRQPLVLKAGKNFVYRSRAGDYWSDEIEL